MAPPGRGSGPVSVTIVMLSVDEAPLLAHSLPAASAQADCEVLVVDNACTDATAELAGRHGARLLTLPRRLSYCAAVNAGLAAAAGDAILLLNADCVVAPGFLGALRGHLTDPGVGSVAPKLLRATDVTVTSRREEIDAAAMVVDHRRKNSLVGHGRPSSRYAVAAEAFGGDGAAVLYRRTTLEHCAVHGEVLDEDFELWAADVDLAWRARLLGWRCAYEPAARAWHVRHYSPSTRHRVQERHRRLQFRNRYLMIIKNDTAAALARDLPLVAAWELLALGHVLLRERHLLAAYAQALALAPGALRRRAVIQARRAPGRVALGLRPPP